MEASNRDPDPQISGQFSELADKLSVYGLGFFQGRLRVGLDVIASFRQEDHLEHSIGVIPSENSGPSPSRPIELTLAPCL